MVTIFYLTILQIFFRRSISYTRIETHPRLKRAGHQASSEARGEVDCSIDNIDYVTGIGNSLREP